MLFEPHCCFSHRRIPRWFHALAFGKLLSLACHWLISEKLVFPVLCEHDMVDWRGLLRLDDDIHLKILIHSLAASLYLLPDHRTQRFQQRSDLELSLQQKICPVPHSPTD